jgi:hypothetical protein
MCEQAEAGMTLGEDWGFLFFDYFLIDLAFLV